MPKLPCPYGSACNNGEDGGTWKTVDIDFADAKLLLDDHVRMLHEQRAQEGTESNSLKAERIARPQIKVKNSQIDEDTWEYFVHQWTTYKISTNIKNNAKQHLENCLGDEVTVILFGRLGQAGWDKLTEPELLNAVKDVFVKKRNRMVNRLKLRGIKQGPDQPIQQYVGALKQAARTCQFTTKCTEELCDGVCDYSEEMVLDQLVQGLNDDEIQKKVLALPEADFKLNKVEQLIISEECSKATQKDSRSGESLAQISTFKKQKQAKGCHNCGEKDHVSYRDLKKEEKHLCPAHGKTCSKCGRNNHLTAVCRSKTSNTGGRSEADHNSISLFSIEEQDQKSGRPKNKKEFLSHLRDNQQAGKFVPNKIYHSNSLTVHLKS